MRERVVWKNEVFHKKSLNLGKTPKNLSKKKTGLLLMKNRKHRWGPQWKTYLEFPGRRTYCSISSFQLSKNYLTIVYNWGLGYPNLPVGFLKGLTSSTSSENPEEITPIHDSRLFCFLFYLPYVNIPSLKCPRTTPVNSRRGKKV